MNQEPSEVLVAGGMVGITAMLREISRSSEALKTIDHGDQKILLEHGFNFFIALNVLEEMKIYWDKLYRLRNLIEIFFKDLLKFWDGNMDYFKPLNNIIKNEFK